MNDLFSIGELSKFQNISKQTLIYYDKIGLFKPDYVDKTTGYRYYSAEQIDYLDTILIMKKIGFSLNKIKEHMKNYNIDNSLSLLRGQLEVIESQIKELTLIKNRLNVRCEQMEKAYCESDNCPRLEIVPEQHILYYDIDSPYDAKNTSIATKHCYAQALEDNLPVFFQCGVSIPLKHIVSGRFDDATTAFLMTDFVENTDNIKTLPQGLAVSIYHFGNYNSMNESFAKLLNFCKENKLTIISDAYEFCINDYITSRYEDEYITKIMFYVEQK